MSGDARAPAVARRAAAARPQPQPAGRARAGGLRHRHPRRPRRRARAGGRGPRPRRSSTSRRNHEGELVDAIHARPRAAAPPSSSTPAPSPTTPGRSTTRWPRSTARSSSCTSPTPTPASRGGTPAWSRPWPTGTIMGFGGDGYELAVEARGPADRRPVVTAPYDLPADRLARRPAAARRRSARRPGPGPHGGRRRRRAARHPPDQHPLPHRLHRVGRPRRWCCPTSWCSSPTAATATRPPSSSPPPASTARVAIGRSPGRPAGRAGRRRRAALGRLGLEAEHVTWAAQRPLRGRAGRPTAGRHRRAGRGRAARSRTRRGGPHRGAPARVAEPALADVVRPARRRARPRPTFALELDTEMRRLGAEGPSFDDDRRRRARTPAKPHHRPVGPPRSARATCVVLDFGALVDGYHSDMTRTVAVGDVDA